MDKEAVGPDIKSWRSVETPFTSLGCRDCPHPTEICLCLSWRILCASVQSVWTIGSIRLAGEKKKKKQQKHATFLTSSTSSLPPNPDLETNHIPI